MAYLNLENIFLLGEYVTWTIFKLGEYKFKSGDIYFLGITLFWLRYEKNLSRPLELNPICIY